jgi:hypothetical protein
MMKHTKEPEMTKDFTQGATCTTIIREETEQTPSLWCGVHRSDPDVNPVFIICESQRGTRLSEIRFDLIELAKLMSGIKKL